MSSPISTISRVSSVSRMSGIGRKPSIKLVWGASKMMGEGDQYQERKVASRNYFGEVDFTTLHFLLRETVEVMIECKKRMNLYQRIATINEGSALQQVFTAKHNDYELYYNQLAKNKS